MHPILRYGLLLGVLCGAWIFVMGFTGWYRDAVLLNLFYLVVLIEIGVLIVGLRQTAATRGYGGQVGAGALISLVGGVVVFGASILFTAVVFPDYFTELRAIQTEMMRQQGSSQAVIDEMMATTEPMQTPVMNALVGLFMTFVTGVVCSLIIAAVYRRK